MTTFTTESFLKTLYDRHFVTHNEVLNYREYGDGVNVAHEIVQRTLDDLFERGLAQAPFMGPTVQITSLGMQYVEENGLADPAVIQRQQQFRTQYLDALAAQRDEHGPQWLVGYSDILTDRGLSEIDFDRNISYLLDSGLMEFAASQLVRITPHGQRVVEGWRQRVGVLDRLEDLKAGIVTPQARGHELEKLLEIVARQSGWGVERNVKRPGEEVDLILHRDFNYFLFSAKWEKAPIEVNAIRDLRERISQRPTSRGVLLSMSGFSSNATDYARERIESAVILLFGPNDVEQTLGGQLNQLLQAKLHAAMSSRLIEWI